MNIRRDLFRIESGGRTADGTKINPEEQKVEHVFQGSAPVNMAAPGVVSTGLKGNIPLEIVAASSAHEVARSVSALCANCKYFDRAGWLKMIADAEGPGSSPAERHSVNAIRAEILINMPDPDAHAGGDGEYDVEHAMKAMGMCHALREFYKGQSGTDPGIIGVFQTSGCPADTCSPGRPQGIFEARDGDSAKASQQNYDAVMNRAAGRIS